MTAGRSRPEKPAASQREADQGAIHHVNRATGLASTIGNASVTGLLRSPGSQRPDGSRANLDESVARAIQQRRGSGAPLSGGVRGEMEHAFGADFSDVRIHTDARSQQLNDSVQARAFTVGNDIFFSTGALNASSSAGQRLLAHELTHVVQQSSANSPVLRGVSDPAEPSERQADAIAEQMVSTIRPHKGPTVQRYGAIPPEGCTCYSGMAAATRIRTSPELKSFRFEDEAQRDVGSLVNDGTKVDAPSAEPSCRDAPRSLGRQANTGMGVLQRLVAAQRQAAPATADRLLKRGMRGPEVTGLQERLNAAPGARRTLTVDGIFGPQTARAVRVFQRQCGLDVDGIAGPDTWAALTGGGSAVPEAESRGAAPETTAEPGAAETSEQAAEAKFGSWIDEMVDRVTELLEPETAGELLSRELEVIFEQFAQVAVTVQPDEGEPRTVHVRTPYFINESKRSSQLTKDVYDKAMGARRRTAATRAFFKQHGWHARHGKATPAEIGDILQSALDEGLIAPQTATRPTAEELRGWLREHGIGVDCSGFVSQALTHLVQQQRYAAGEQGPVEHRWRGTGALRPESEGFTKVDAPRDLAPGDTMSIPGHVRIVASVHIGDEGLEFTTYESRAGGRERIGMAEHDWRYPDPDQFANLQRQGPDGRWASVRGSPKYARYDELAS